MRRRAACPTASAIKRGGVCHAVDTTNTAVDAADAVTDMTDDVDGVDEEKEGC